MEVILQENVSNLGFVGDVVKVKPGYARNFLFPRRLAAHADQGNIRRFEHQKKLIEVKKAQKKSEALDLKKRLEAVSLTIAHAAGEGEKLFGSVTSVELVDAIKVQGFDIDRKLIRTEAPIRTIGKHDIEIKLHQDVTAKLTVTVEAKTV